MVVMPLDPGQQGANRFEQMRRARNQQRYQARSVSEADSAIRSCRDIFDGALAKGLSPQL